MNGDNLIFSSNQPVSVYNQPVCNHQEVKSTTLSRYVIRTSSIGPLWPGSFGEILKLRANFCEREREDHFLCKDFENFKKGTHINWGQPDGPEILLPKLGRSLDNLLNS